MAVKAEVAAFRDMLATARDRMVVMVGKGMTGTRSTSSGTPTTRSNGPEARQTTHG